MILKNKSHIMNDDFNYYGNPDEYMECMLYQQILDFYQPDPELETNEDLKVIIENCGFVREKKLLKIKSKICNSK